MSNRCIDTTGYTSEKELLEVASKSEHFLYDIKVMDDEKHKLHTGVGNKQILKNLQLLATTTVDINIRIPLIRGVNDDLENIKQTAEFINTLEKPPIMVNILPYHNIAQKKYEKLGRLEKFVKWKSQSNRYSKKLLNILSFME